MFWVSFIIGTVVAIFLGFIPAKIASDKGRSFGLWWLYGFLLFIVALIHSVLLKDESKTQKEKVLTEAVPTRVGLAHIPDTVDIHALVTVDGYTIENTIDAVIVKIKLTNFTDKSVRSIKISAKGFNDFGDSVYMNGSDSFEMLLQDMSLDSSIIYNYELPKEVSTARKFSFTVDQVCYATGEIQNCEQPIYVKTCTADEIDNDYYLRFAKTKSVDAKYYSEDHETYWSCICGCVNTGNKCHYCLIDKTTAIQFTKENIADTCSEFVAKVQKEEQKKAEFKEKLDNQKEKIMSVADSVVSGINNVTSTAINNSINETSEDTFFISSEYEAYFKKENKIFSYLICIWFAIFAIMQLIIPSRNTPFFVEETFDIFGSLTLIASLVIMCICLLKGKNLFLPTAGFVVSSLLTFLSSNTFYVYYNYIGKKSTAIGSFLTMLGYFLTLILILVLNNNIQIKYNNIKILAFFPLCSGILIIISRIIYSIRDLNDSNVQLRKIAILWILAYIIQGVVMTIISTKIYTKIICKKNTSSDTTQSIQE